MNHQWDLFPEAPGDVRVRCTACGKDAVVINNMIGRFTAVEECPAAVEGVLLSTPTLVQIDEDLWVNPDQVTHIGHAARQASDGTPTPNMTRIYFVQGSAMAHKPLAETVALINGSA